jgi:predicted metal-dependent hydrolase
MYVILHELAHLASVTYGHNQEFNENFQWVAKNAQDMGYYKYINFTMQPKEYCGMQITTSII